MIASQSFLRSGFFFSISRLDGPPAGVFLPIEACSFRCGGRPSDPKVNPPDNRDDQHLPRDTIQTD